MMTTRPTDRHRRRIPTVVIAVLGLFATAALASGPAVAGTAPPTLSAKLNAKGTTVTLRWEFVSDARQRDRVVVVERAEQGGPFVEVQRRKSASARGSWADKHLPATPLRYRTQLLVAGAGTGWSETVTVPAAHERSSTPTTATPTTATPTTATPTTAGPTTTGPGVTACPASWTTTIFDAVNDARRGNGRPALNRDPKLSVAAARRGVTMATARAMTHTGWVAEVDRSGYVWTAIAENIHRGVGHAAVTPGWMTSAGHRANILNALYDDAGVGCALDRNGVAYYALLLGRGH